MELTQYVENLRRELTTAAEVGGEDARALACLVPSLDVAVRLTLLERSRRRRGDLRRARARPATSGCGVGRPGSS